MKVQCSGCKSNYGISDDKIPAAGAKLKCPRCQKIIEVAKPAIVQNIPVLQPTKENTVKTGRAKSESRQYTEKKASKAWAVMTATVVGFVVLCLSLGIPLKNDKKPDKREIPEIVMPFNFANDKLAEFKYFIETMEQKWGAHPANLLNLQDYPAPDEYGHSQYGVEENDLIVEFFFFFNQLYQSTINTQNSDDAKRWVEYLDSNFGEKETNGKFYTWRNDDLNIAYESESNQYQFHFIHTETFAERQKYRDQFRSKLVKFEVFKKIIDNDMNWAVTTDNLPDMTLHQKTDAYKWSEYSIDNATNLYYKFFQDSLCRVDILVLDSELTIKMQGILESKFGEGEINLDGSIKWVADGITITTFNYLRGKGFTFTHNETLKAKEEYAKNLKSPQKKIALKKKRNKEAVSTSDSDGPRQTMRKDKVEDSLKRIAGHRPQKPGRQKVSGRSRGSMTLGQRRVLGVCTSNCTSVKYRCLRQCRESFRSIHGNTRTLDVGPCDNLCYDEWVACKGYCRN